MNTHLPIEHIKSVTLSIYIYFGWFMGWEMSGDGVVGGFMGLVGVWWWGGLLEGSWDGCIYSPTHEPSVKKFNFMNTHPPTHQIYPKCHSVTIHTLWMVHGWVDGGGVVGGFMGWVVVGWVVGGFMGWVGV